MTPMRTAPVTWHSPCGIHAFRRRKRRCAYCARRLEEVRAESTGRRRFTESTAPRTKVQKSKKGRFVHKRSGVRV